MKIFLIFLGMMVTACGSAPKVDEPLLSSPQSQQLVAMAAYQGVWFIDRCEFGGKQAQKIEIKVADNHLVMTRWQWRRDSKPLFTARIQNGTQTLVNYTAKDMRDRYQVVNRSQWTWLDQRIVGTLQWLPTEGDQRGNWAGVAMAQLYIDKADPDTMIWSRWGSTHSATHGKQDWQSKCSYRRVSVIAQDKGDLDQKGGSPIFSAR